MNCVCQVVLYAEDAEGGETEENGMKRMAVCVCCCFAVRAAWAENFSAYEIKTHGFPILRRMSSWTMATCFFTLGMTERVQSGKDHPWHLSGCAMETVSDFPYRTTIRVRGTHHPLCRSAMNAI